MSNHDATLKAELEAYQSRAYELDQTVFDLRALLQSGKGFSEILCIEELLDAFMSVCRERYGVDSSAVLLKDDLDRDAVYYRVRAFHNLPASFTDTDGDNEELLMFRLPHNRGMLWQVIQQGEVFGVLNLEGEPRFVTAWERWNLDTLKSTVWVPLLKGGDVLGVLTIGPRADGSTVPESQFRFLQEIASVAATNINSTLQYEKNSHILRNIRTLYDINQQLANVNDFKQLTAETLHTAVEAMGAQKANLMLLNPETNELEIKVVGGDIPKPIKEGINDGTIATRTLEIGEGVAGRAAKAGKPVRINHRSRIEQFGKTVAHCILSVPLLYGGELQGVMTMTNKVKTDDGRRVLDSLGRFTEQDEQLAVGLADQAAVNLHKARLYDASITDRMTGLKNTRHFEETLATMIRRTDDGEAPFALAVTDIDHFKRFNDTYGHKAGDFVLQRLAALMEQSANPHGDRVFRYGGEEFCVLLPNTHVEDAVIRLDACRKLVEQATFDWEGEALSVTISVGICAYPDDASNAREVFEKADAALYVSKDSGRNRVSFAGAEGVSTKDPITAEAQDTANVSGQEAAGVS